MASDTNGTASAPASGTASGTTSGTTDVPDGRRYGGLGADERRSSRRDALLAAGLEEFGTHGYPNVPVKQLCTTAGLTQRYFYESFGDREALLAAVYEQVVTDVRERVFAAIGAAADRPLPELIRATLGAFVGCLTEDRRKARVMLLEVVGVSAALETRRHGVIHEFAGVITAVGQARSAAPTGGHGPQVLERHTLAAVAMVGSVNQLLVDWISGQQGRDPALILEVCTDLFTAAYDRFYGGDES